MGQLGLFLAVGAGDLAVEQIVGAGFAEVVGIAGEGQIAGVSVAGLVAEGIRGDKDVTTTDGERLRRGGRAGRW